MRRARYRGDVTDQFHPGQVIGQTLGGAAVKCVAVEYNPDTDTTIVTGEHTAPTAPDGMRMRFHGNTGTDAAPTYRAPLADDIEAR